MKAPAKLCGLFSKESAAHLKGTFLQFSPAAFDEARQFVHLALDGQNDRFLNRSLVEKLQVDFICSRSQWDKPRP